MNQPPRIYVFENFRLNPSDRVLFRDKELVSLTPKVFDTLLLLIENAGHLVEKDEFMKRLWPETFVGDDTLAQNISILRRALAKGDDTRELIATVTRRGYRFVGTVRQEREEEVREQLEGSHNEGQAIPDRIAAVPGGISGRNISPTRGEVRISEILPGRTHKEISPQAGARSAERSSTRGSVGRAVFTGAAIATGILAEVLAYVLLSPARVPKVLRFTQLTRDGQSKGSPIITDGSRIYFNEVLPGPRRLVVQVSVNGGDVVPLSVPLKQPRVLDISKDGNQLLIANGEGDGPSSLWLQPVAGGSPMRVGTVLADKAQFGADGTSIIYSVGTEIRVVNQDGSSSRKLFSTDGYPHSFRFSPDAKAFRFSLYNFQIDSTTIMEAAADGSGLHEMFLGSCGRWTPDGKYFTFENLQNGRWDLWTVPDRSHFSWRKPNLRPIQLIRYDSRSHEFVPYLSGISAEGLDFSRDGQWVTYASYPDGTLLRSKMDGTERLQLTFPPLRVLLPRWSADGKRIAFNATLPGQVWNIYVISSDGGTPQRVLPSDQNQMDASWSPDGNALVFGTLIGPNAPPSAPIHTIDLRSGHISTLPGSTGLFSPRWSSDGRYIAAITAERPFKLMLFDYANQKWSELFRYDMGYPSWSLDGKYIYFQTWRNPEQATEERIVRLRLSDRKVENVVDVEHVGRLTAGTITDWFGLAPDGSPLFARDIGSQELYALDVQWP